MDTNINRKIPDRSVAGRWTEDLIKDGYTPVVDTFLEHYSDLGITTTESMFIIHLMSYKWDKKHPYPSFGALSKKMGVTDTAVRNYARNLEKKKLLRRVQREGETNIFDLSPLFLRLEHVRQKANEAKTSSRDIEKQITQDSFEASKALWDALPAEEQQSIQAGVVASLPPMIRRKWETGGAKPFVETKCLMLMEQRQQIIAPKTTTENVKNK